MGLICTHDYYEGDNFEWWWYPPDDEAPLATKRSRKCCSCGRKINVGDMARKIRRYRSATEWEATRGFGDEKQIADWYLCDTCGDLAYSLAELGFCYTLDESLQQQIAEYRETEARAALTQEGRND